MCILPRNEQENGLKSQSPTYKAYIGIGSNLGNRISFMRSAIVGMKHIGKVVSTSSIYETEPFQVNEVQPMYLNMAIELHTSLTPSQLLAELQKIETTNGRHRTRSNEPRTLDLDILMIDQLMIQQQHITVPHPRMHLRAFVLAPLAEIAPTLMHPKLNKTISQLLQHISQDGVAKLGKLQNVKT